MQYLTSVLAILAGLYLTVAMVAFGRRTPGYRHLRNTISELGQVGAPYQSAIALGVFLPVGFLAFASAWLLYPTSQAAAALAGCIGIGYIGAAFFPCDPGSPVSGSVRQGVHNLAGGIEYIGGGAALYSLSHTQGEIFRVMAFITFTAALFLTVMPRAPFRGLVQRFAEACLFGGLVAVAALVGGPNPALNSDAAATKSSSPSIFVISPLQQTFR